MKTKILIALLILAGSLQAQEKITVNVSQDARLLVAGDDKGNDPLTLNYTLRSEWQGKQLGEGWTSGYMFVAPEFEYADLAGGIYRRYSANIGYTFNKVFEHANPVTFYANNTLLLTFDPSRLDFTASAGYGIIQYNGGYRGFGANFQLGYRIGNTFTVFLDAELVDRKDLQIYGSSEIRFSGEVRT